MDVPVSYRIAAKQSGSQWIAHAVREDTGQPFGVECVAPTEQEAIARMSGWLEWQREHTAALEALQAAERAYHKTLAGSVFANPSEGPTPLEMQKESLDAVEAARIRLDEIRARKPD